MNLFNVMKFHESGCMHRNCWMLLSSNPSLGVLNWVVWHGLSENFNDYKCWNIYQVGSNLRSVKLPNKLKRGCFMFWYRWVALIPLDATQIVNSLTCWRWAPLLGPGHHPFFQLWVVLGKLLFLFH